jgi:hypothetical protein
VWLEDSGENHADDFEVDVVKHLTKTHESDGYKLAKDMEGSIHMLFPDADLVRVLDDFDLSLDRVLNLARKNWVVTNQWVPIFKPGDLVLRPAHTDSNGKPRGTETVKSVITRVYADRGVYAVQNGDVPEGNVSYLFDWECVEKRS